MDVLCVENARKQQNEEINFNRRFGPLLSL